jgi:hypothetical protein
MKTRALALTASILITIAFIKVIYLATISFIAI